MIRLHEDGGGSAAEVVRALEQEGIACRVDRESPGRDGGRWPASVVIVVGGAGETGARLRLGSVTVDLGAGTCTREGVVHPLRRREWSLLGALAGRRGVTVPTPVLLERVWGRLDRREALHTTLRRLREKVEFDPGRPRWLVTVRGVGVRLESER